MSLSCADRAHQDQVETLVEELSCTEAEAVLVLRWLATNPGMEPVEALALVRAAGG